VKFVLSVLSSICQGILFMYLGITTVVSDHHLDLVFIICTLTACLVTRVVGKDVSFVYYMSYIIQLMQTILIKI